MNPVKQVLLFCYRFLIGDDWLGAVIILLGFALTYVLSRNEVDAYWFLPATVLLSLGSSIVRLHRRNPSKQDEIIPQSPRRVSTKI